MNGRNWIVAGLAGTALAWLAGGIASAQGPVTPVVAGKPAAIVNGEAIPMEELEALLKQAPSPVEMTEEVRRGTRRHALTMLIDDTLMQQFLKAQTPPVAKADVDQKIAEMEAALKKENKTVESFCKENGQSVAQLRDGLTWMMRWASWVNAHVSEEDVKRYYQAYKDQYDGTTVRVSHIALRLADNATEADRARAKAQLGDIRAQILAGKVDFASAAKQYSQCDSRTAGGDLGFLQRKMADESFGRTAFSMKPGQVSDVFATGFGMHIIVVTERKEGKPLSDYAKIKDQVRMDYAEDVRLAILGAQRKAAKIEVNIP